MSNSISDAKSVSSFDLKIDSLSLDYQDFKQSMLAKYFSWKWIVDAVSGGFFIA